MTNSAFTNGLAARGHNVTVISPDREKNPPNGVHYIQMNGLYDGIYKETVKEYFTPYEVSPFAKLQDFTGLMEAVCKEILATDGFETLSSYPNDFRFDLIIHDITLGSCLLGFMHKFNYPPVIAVTAFSHPPYMHQYVGGHYFTSYIPHYELPYSQEMNFSQRFMNFLVHIYDLFNWEYSFVKNIDKLLEGKFGPGMPSISELEKRTALGFVSTHPVFDYARPQLENVIAVGGLQIRDPNPLPKELNDFIESSKKGTVLFSLGSNFNASLMSVDKQNAFIDAFTHFPDYNFIWKFEKEMKNFKLPKNVILRPWLPQSDILAHPKIKAFISHGGLLGSFESLWRGVPVIGIPFGFDQTSNIMKLRENGMAEMLDYHTTTMELIRDTLQKVLENPKYLQNAKKMSARFQDQKEKPLDRAVWWAEWLIRNPDCDYLKSPEIRMTS
ncbi:UDP-glycosyltransferase UGT5 [Pseudolycoriella hygida]|uniref:UDP-glucuronosyltransferase n=1 Tax=Pseudolycoriella hygida TaxID=35572 RepID=A0A9Q0N6N1_9DIPT|nr:UDP-glycosyltransferase UGT5 [Pseudolycoriella hygida]